MTFVKHKFSLLTGGLQNVQVALIAAALKAAKNKGYTVKAFPRLNHLFQTVTTGLPSEYGKIEETKSPEVLQTVSHWISKRTK